MDDTICRCCQNTLSDKFLLCQGCKNDFVCTNCFNSTNADIRHKARKCPNCKTNNYAFAFKNK